MLPLAALLLQSDPLEALRKDLGAGFSVTRIDPALLLASDADDPEARQRLEALMSGLRARAFAPAGPPFRVVLVEEESSLAKVARTTVRGPGHFDFAGRRLVALRSHFEALVPQAVLTALVWGEAGAKEAPPPWLPAGLTGLFEKPVDPSPVFDHRAALLREAVRRKRLPGLAPFLKADLERFLQPDLRSLHASTATRLLAWLESRKALQAFFAEYRKSAPKDPSGATALAAALRQPLAETEKAFAAHLLELPWLDRPRFEEQARKAFGDATLIRIDDDLTVAFSGNVTEKSAAAALDHLRAVREPLVQAFGLEPSGLPILVRMFRDAESFRAYARLDAPTREWLGGYYRPDTRWIATYDFPGSLTHEYVHSVVGETLQKLPPWLNEGLAELHTVTRLSDGRPVPDRGGTPADLKDARLPPFSAFLNFQGKDFWSPEALTFTYPLSRAAALYLHERGALVKVVKTLKDQRAKYPLGFMRSTCIEAVEQALGKKLAEIDGDFRAWLAEAGK